MKIDKSSEQSVWVAIDEWVFYLDTSVDGEQTVSCYKKGEDGTLDKTEGGEDVFLITNHHEYGIQLLTDKAVAIDSFSEGESK